MKRFECDVCGKAVTSDRDLHSLVRHRLMSRGSRVTTSTDNSYPLIEYCDECQQSTFAAWVEHHNAIYDTMANRAHARRLVGSTPEGETER